MGREKRPYTRTSEVRDAKLFVIATEGQKTEVEYFDGIIAALKSTRVHVQLLKRDESNSSPDYIIKLIDAYVDKYKLNMKQGDELWLVIDRDKQSWSESQISLIAQECIQKGYGLALSNPCFEVWLLLHFKDISSECSEQDKQKYLDNKRVSRNNTVLKKEVSAELLKCVPPISSIAELFPFVKDAIARARNLDGNPNDRWPLDLGTRVYLLADSIINSA